MMPVKVDPAIGSSVIDCQLRIGVWLSCQAKTWISILSIFCLVFASAVIRM